MKDKLKEFVKKKKIHDHIPNSIWDFMGLGICARVCVETKFEALLQILEPLC